MPEIIKHPIAPAWNSESEVLILGSFPSVKSRESAYFYGHPQNRFWPVLAALFQDRCPVSNQEKQDFLLKHHVAVWDVIASCEIDGSADSSIRNVRANNINIILENAKIRQIFCNGQTAYRLYQKYILPVSNRTAVCLPSTSPANARWTFDRLVQAWSVIIL